MGCNCKNADGFRQKLGEAKKNTKRDGVTWVVFVVNEIVFICKETELKDDFGMCCYFTPDGNEVEYTPTGKLSTDKKPAAKIVKDPVSDADYKYFVDHGKVSETLLKAIAKKVKARTKLSERENAVFVGKTTDVNEIISALAKK